MQKLALSVDTALGLAAFTEETNKTKSGFRPADFGSADATPLFGDVRLEGFVSMLRVGFAKRLYIVGGGKYCGRNLSEGEIWLRMLSDDYGIEQDRLSALDSAPNTKGNAKAIAEFMRYTSLLSEKYAVVSNGYHLFRSGVHLEVKGLRIPHFPAEAFWLLERGYGDEQILELARRLGGGPLAERVALEARGIAQEIDGTFRPLTN